MQPRRASRTAVLVCQSRAVAHGLIVPDRFVDPTAMPLLREDERAAVRRVRQQPAPRDWRQRVEYQMLRASAEVIVPRTVAIDDAVRARPTPQLVILGAGLDGRAWRMPELAGVEVFEVDQPASQRDKRERAEGLPAAGPAPRFVAVDFGRDRLGDALQEAGHREDAPTTWIWEGVVPYLTRAEVGATLGALAARSAPGSRLVVNYQQPSLGAALGRLAARAMAATARRANPWANEPQRSTWTPEAMRQLVAAHGFTVDRDDDLLTLATALGGPVGRRGSLRNGRVVVADR